MTLRTSIRLPIVASALAAVLVIAPTASASPDPFVLHRNAQNVIDPHGTQAGYNAQKVTPPAADAFAQSGPSTASVPSVPDRTDLLGTSRGPQVVQVPTATASDGGINWSDAMIGAAFLLAASLLAVFVVMSARGRGRGGLPMPS